MFCIHCGKKIDNAKVCPYCGIRVEGAPAPKTAAPGVQSNSQNAQSANTQGANTQNNVQKPAAPTPAPTPAPKAEVKKAEVKKAKPEKKAAEPKKPVKKEKKSKGGLIAAIVIVSILLVGALGTAAVFAVEYFFDIDIISFGDDSGDKDAESKAEEESKAADEKKAEEDSVPPEPRGDEREPGDDMRPEKSPEELEREKEENAVKDADNYIPITASVSWYEAKSAAAAYGDNTHLVTINSREEFDHVCTIAENAGLKLFWVGIRVNDLTDWRNKPMDVNGDRFKIGYVNWLTGEPSGVDKSLPEGEQVFEDCMAVLLNGEGKWVAIDAPGDTVYSNMSTAGYIVEIEE